MNRIKVFGVALFCCIAFTLNVSKAQQTIIDELKKHKQTSNFAMALEKANLHERLSEPGPFTIFAPSNETFNKLSSREKFNRDLLLNHIFTGMATERSLRAMSDITCLSGRTIKVGRNQGLSIENFAILESNIRAKNGVIHLIDGVIK
jgi:uncharacterized surface protein with fasciclin (FAS1) repeats